MARSDEAAYRKVFEHGTHANVWVVSAHVLKLAERALHDAGRRQQSLGRFVRNWRHVATLFYIVRTLGRFGYTPHDLASLDTEKLTPKIMEETVAALLSLRSKRRKLKRWYAAEAKHAAADMAKRFDLDGLGSWWAASWSHEQATTASLDDEDLAMRANELLPEQPWQPGVHRDVAKELKCSPRKVQHAINLLIHNGVRHTQKDGIVYDREGYVIAVDRNRVGTTKLKSLHWRGAAVDT